MTDVFGSIGNMLNAVTHNSFFGKLSVTAGALATAYFAPIAGLLFACFTCTTVDLLYGLKVARQAGRKLTSSKSWSGTLRKLRDEFTIIALAHLIEHVIGGAASITLLSGGATALICLTELWSILENLNTLNPDGPWRILSGFLKKKGEAYTGVDLTVNKDGKLDIKADESAKES